MERLKSLDGLRGLLAVYVMLGHMAPFAMLPEWLATALSHGGAAVDVFFILSGFAIVQSLNQHGYRAKPFLSARLARIFPVYLAMLALAIAVQTVPTGFDRMPWIAAGSPAFSIWSDGWPRDWVAGIAAHLTMTHGLFPNGALPDVWVEFLGAAWSLSTEWQFYVLALLLGRRAWTALLALTLAGAVWAAIAPHAWQFSRAFLGNKAAYFALGMVSAAGGGRFAAALLVALAFGWWQGGAGKLLPPLVWLACWTAEQRGGWLATGLRSGPAQWFGRLSYCLYLANEPVQKLAGVGLSALAGGDGQWFTVVWLPCATGLPILVAMALRRWIELPALAWARRGGYTRRDENAR